MKDDFKLIKLSQDRKVQGIKGERNSFGLPAISTCPERTPYCEALCYGCKGMFVFSATKNMYKQNYGALQTILLKMPLVKAADVFIEEIKRYNRSGIFRWDITGDVYSERYWELILLIAYKMPEITFWIYTRSFKTIRWTKSSIPQNLKVILSFDKDNAKRASNPFTCAIYGSRTISWMGNKKDAEKVFPNRKWITCPEVSGKIELQSACANCRLCFDHKKPASIGIHFPTNVEEGRKPRK